MRKQKSLPVVLALALLAVLMVTGCSSGGGAPAGQETGGEKPGDGTTLRIGSQGYAEVEIQAEIAKALIEAKTNHKVEHVRGLGSSMATHEGTVSGDLDMNVSFTGTLFLGLLEQKLTPEWRDPDKVWQYVHDKMLEKYNLYIFPAYGYNNVYAIAVPRQMAEEMKLEKISDLAPYAKDLRVATDTTWQDYPGQGYKEFQELYGFSFKEAIPMDFGLMYRAIANDEVDAIVTYSTDGRNISHDLVILEDDKQFNPPYYGILVARNQTLQEHPEVKEALEVLGGLIDTETMMSLNARVDVDEEEPAKVARDFLKEKGLI
ncbi:MAG: osmoprotectant ABC transporter substrate-binding protein [Firmicutes bacterium]|jgi:osmoprotectant transport system substrate-binding protein|nr:osmoprotectant ABC transporter substrate-binding protein [Bacillota bacterium]